MSGPFYGALAASASVFVAILTALLVNNYIQIKSERRQLTRRINQVKRDLKDLREDKGDYEGTIEQIEKQREQANREEAQDNVQVFIQDYLYDHFTHPIETLTVDDLYEELLDYYDCSDSDELEDSDKHHHRDVLEDRKEKIDELVLNRTVREFSSRYEGRGTVEDPRNRDDSDFSEEEGKFFDNVDFGMDLEDFIDEYKQEYDINDLDDRTRELLKEEYNETVDNDDRKFGDMPPTDERVAEILGEILGAKLSSGQDPPTIGDVMEEGKREQKYETARDNLVQVKSEIESLERTKEDLQQQKEGQHPEDLKPTLYVNAATIFLSVVVPVIAYLATVTETTITVPQLLSHTEINVFLSWLLGLIIVFVALYCRIENEN